MHWTAHSAFPADMCSGAASAMLHGLASQPGRVRARAVLVSSAYPKVVVEAASQCRLPHARRSVLHARFSLERVSVTLVD